jgi:predicted nucleic acid-binding protein
VIVADASAVVELLLGGRRGRAVEVHLSAVQGHIHAPALIDAEVTQALRKLVERRTIDEPRGRASVEMLQALPIERVSLQPLLPRMWALRGNLTAYDAAYVALAEGLDCPLLTFDQRVAGAPGVEQRVVVPTVTP